VSFDVVELNQDKDNSLNPSTVGMLRQAVLPSGAKLRVRIDGQRVAFTSSACSTVRVPGVRMTVTGEVLKSMLLIAQVIERYVLCE
jgi:hypothetical protein